MEENQGWDVVETQNWRELREAEKDNKDED